MIDSLRKAVSSNYSGSTGMFCILLSAFLVCAGCQQQQQEAAMTPEENTIRNPKAGLSDSSAASGSDKPCRKYDIRRFAANSPFEKAYESPIPKEGKRIWATSRLWEKAPELTVEKWLTEKPDIAGKYLLIEFWATWCSQCKRAVPLLNDFQRRFADDLVVIGIADQSEDAVESFARKEIEYSVAVDTKARMKTELAVAGIPHCIVVEPGGYVVWEGFPFLDGYELTAEEMARIIKVGETRVQ